MTLDFTRYTSIGLGLLIYLLGLILTFASSFPDRDHSTEHPPNPTVGRLRGTDVRPFPWGTPTPSLIHGSLDHHVHSSNGTSTGPSVAVKNKKSTNQKHISRQSQCLSVGRTSPSSKFIFCKGHSRTHLIHDSLGPYESTTQTVSRSVQPLLQWADSAVQMFSAAAYDSLEPPAAAKLVGASTPPPAHGLSS